MPGLKTRNICCKTGVAMAILAIPVALVMMRSQYHMINNKI